MDGLRRKRDYHVLAFWRNLNDERTQRIIAMVKEGATLEEIGQALGSVTKQYIHELLANIQRAHGSEVFGIEAPLFNTSEVAQLLKAPQYLIIKLCKEKIIPSVHRATKRGKYLLNAQSIEVLRVHPLVTGKKICRICGKLFVLPKSQRHRTLCFRPKCKSVYYRQRRAILCKQVPTADSLFGWHSDLWQQLRHRRFPQSEKWIGFHNACCQTGLSKMQLRWLRSRMGDIIATQPDPKRTRNGKPYLLYAASQMEIVRKVYAAWQRKQKRRKKKKSP